MLGHGQEGTGRKGTSEEAGAGGAGARAREQGGPLQPLCQTPPTPPSSSVGGSKGQWPRGLSGAGDLRGCDLSPLPAPCISTIGPSALYVCTSWAPVLSSGETRGWPLKYFSDALWPRNITRHITKTVFNEKKKLECPVVSQICTLWPLRFHQEFYIFRLMQPICPGMPSFAHLDDSCFTRLFFF